MNWTAAITSRHLVSFSYHGQSRVVIPAAYGRHATTGNLVLRGYQVRGSSVEGDLPGWRLFLVDEAGGAQMLDESFVDPPGYRHGDRDMSPIFGQL
jgi:hypothetical protein